MNKTMTTIRAKNTQQARECFLIWPDDVIKFLISRIRDAPYIWDCRHTHFNTNNLKTEFWSHLAKTIQQRFRLSVTTGDLIEKWTNLTRAQNLTKMSTNDEMKTMKYGKFVKLLDFLEISKQNDNDLWQEKPKDEVQQNAKALQKRLNIVNVQSELNTSNKSNEASEDGNIVDDEDDDVEMMGATPVKNTQREDDNLQSYHYGMAIAKDIYELSEDLKIDAKIEIMKIIGKYQKRQLHRTTQH